MNTCTFKEVVYIYFFKKSIFFLPFYLVFTYRNKIEIVFSLKLFEKR